MWVLAGTGATLAGLFLILRSLLPWMAARSSGVIRTKSAKAQLIDRRVDPERFESLCSQRLRGVWPGLALFLGAGLFTVLEVASIVILTRQ